MDLPKDVTLEKFFEAILKLANDMFNDLGCVHPTYICIDKDHNLFPTMGPDLPKDLLVIVMRKFFKLKNVVMYAHMDEAWMLDHGIATKEEAEAEVEKYGGTLRNHPNRVEAINVVAEQGMNIIAGGFKIIRPKGDKPYLEPLERTTRAVGRFTGLLMPHQTPQ